MFGISPVIARDFSFMIQSVGMTAAAFTIMSSNIRIEYSALKFVSLGGVVGQVIGLEFITPHLPPPFSKMLFVTIWGSFAFSLFLLNRNYGRTVLLAVHGDWNDWRLCGGFVSMTALLLTVTGIFGGIFSAMAGSGIDICSFAMLTLLFRIDEKVATPTSVVLMAGNTCVGFFYREFVQGGVAPEAWPLFLVCIPVVVLGAPLGSVVGSYLHRLTLSGFVYATDFTQFVGRVSTVPALF